MITKVRIATVGDLVLDVLVTSDAGAARDAAGAVRIAPGGSAANFAVSASRAGAQVTFFGRVGDDVAGRLVVAELEREGVTARVAVTAGRATGNVLVLVGADGASRMISDPGASALLAPEDLDAAVIGAADVVHVTGYSWLREGPGPAARAAVRMARERSEGRAITTLDPGPAHLVTAYGRAKLRAELAIARFDVLLPNLEEGAAMTGEEAPAAIARSLRELADVVVVKAGADGAWVAWGDRVEHVAAAPAVVVDTTGAGDAFAAGFAVAYAQRRDAREAAGAGARAAAVIVGRVGSR